MNPCTYPGIDPTFVALCLWGEIPNEDYRKNENEQKKAFRNRQ